MKWYTRILYAPIEAVLHLLAWMPWWVLHLHADLLYFIVYRIIGYRRKVVKQNLIECFPEKDETERKAIEKEFYHHFADFFFETIKLLHIKEDDMRKRFVINNLDFVIKAFDNDQSVILYLSHYGNWEWFSSLSLWLSPEIKASGHLLGATYMPLHNKWFDNYFFKLRSRFGLQFIQAHQVLRVMLRTIKKGKHIGIGFNSDQHPLPNDQDHVVKFLNHPTAMITVTESIARKLDMRVVFMHIKKVKRSHYVCDVIPMCEHAAQTPQGSLTDMFAKMLEENIKEEPAYWLWTHKRWKRPVSYPATRETGNVERELNTQNSQLTTHN